MNSFTKPFKLKLKALLSLALMIFFFQSNAQTYCVSSATSTGDEEIFNVSIGTLNNTSTCSTTGGPGSTLSMYSDYTATVPAPFLIPNVTYPLSVTVGECLVTPYSAGVTVYIDYNNNGVFTDLGEQVFVSALTTIAVSGTAITTSITIPPTATTGLRRMRVIAVESATGTASCGTYTWGETEDYNVNIGVPPTYDIAMNAVLAPSSWAVGNNALQVKVGNFGLTTLTSADIGYSINGGTPVNQTVTFPTALTTGQTYNHTYTTQANLPSAGTYTLKVWCRNPNSIGPDGNTTNDTLTKTVCTGIAGSFTINPSGSGATNFLSFTEAANKLNSCGVSGPCYFTVSPGTYNEKFTLTNVMGASATNTITFDGVDSTTRIITYNETVAVAATINIAGTPYVTIKNLVVANTGTTYGSGINILTGSDYTTIDKCRVSVTPFASTSNIYAISISNGSYSSGNNASWNTIKNCRVTGGYWGVVLYGLSYTATTPYVASSVGNKVLGCTLTGQYYYGIYSYYQGNHVFRDNRVLETNATSMYGIVAYYSLVDTIERNIVQTPYIGIYSYYNNYYSSNQAATAHSLIANNIINTNNAYAYSTNYGLYVYYNYAMDVLHNTVYTSSSATTTIAYTLYLYGGGNQVIKNNIFQGNNTIAYAMYVGVVPTTPLICDNNILYTPGTNYVYWGVAYANLAALKSANPLYHQNSLYKMGNFADITNTKEDLHLSTSSASDIADFAYTLPVDVDNEARCLLAPSIGADDSKFGAGGLIANYSNADTIFVNSPSTFANYMPASTPSYKQWYVDGSLVSTSHDLLYTFNTPGTYTLKLKMIGCFATDSVSKTITVYNLTQRPIANFISDKNTIPTNQNVSFKDLSTKGPSYWQWSVNPTVGVTFVNGTTSNSQNPVMNFVNAGLYTICLWDSNAIGKGNSACKTSYILVQASVNMCAGASSTKVAAGNIYDDGGQALNYTVNKTCSFLIDPCASSVSLTFNNFSAASGTFFRAYDGIDNTGTPLHTGTGFTGTGIPSKITANSGKMFIEFATGGSPDKGFDASWTSVAGTFAPPVGKIIAPDTADDCGSLSTFTFASDDAFFNKDAGDYTWYFTNSTFPTFSSKGLYSVQYGFTTAGIYPIRLEVNGCGGISTFYDTIRVVTPTTAPIIDFSASTVRGTISDVITLTDLSKYGTTSRMWTITGPGSVIKVAGDSSTSTRSFTLSSPGTYTVKLSGTNCKGTDQLTRTGYITIFNYCTPIVSNLNPDFAIERVAFGRIDTIVNGEIKGFDYTNISPALGTIAYRDNTSKIKNYSFGVKAVEAVVELGGTYNFSISRGGNLNSANINVWLDYNQDGTFQASELAASSGVLTGKTWNGSLSVPTSALTGTTRMRIGTAVGLQSNLPCGANLYGDFNDYRVRVTADLSAPTISFNGNNTIYVEVGRVFTDPGFTVVDNITMPCPFTRTGVTSGTQITSHPYSTSYTVTATDAAGNVSSRTRTVMSSPDVTKPVITLNGTSPLTVAVGSIYNDAGATATDFFFGSLTSSVVSNSTVNTAVTGTYKVTYYVTDAAGNMADSVVRTVIVKDTQKPVITITGANPLYVEVLSTFNAPVATVTDNYCTGLTYNVTGSVNANVLGTYTLTYTATDCSGNDAVPAVLTVIVRDTKAPTLLFILGDTIVIDVKTLTVVPEPGFVLADNYYNVNVLTVNVNNSNVKLDVVGNYAVRYYVSDPSGNMDSSHLRVYKIVDRTAPVINLIGLTYLDWKRWTPYVDPGSLVTDNYYTNLLVTPDASMVNIYLDGVYPVKFNITDPSGNKAAEVIRYVRVYTAPSGINTADNANVFEVYPNPNNGIMNVDLNLKDASYAAISIFDANGRIVYSKTINNTVNNKFQVELNNEAAGIYFIKVASDKYNSSRSIVIQK